jgi:hypothetical protein
MKKFVFKSLFALLLMGLVFVPVRAAVVVIGHDQLIGLDEVAINRIYTGKMIEVQGIAVSPVNLYSATELRSRFMQQIIGQDDDKYIAYWVVRRSIGRGFPPKEFSSPSEVLNYVKNTPGAIGYVDEADVTSGVKVLLKK